MPGRKWGTRFKDFNRIEKITSELSINLIYKTSFDKANRTSLKGKRGLGLEKSLPIFDKIRKEIGVPANRRTYSRAM